MIASIVALLQRRYLTAQLVVISLWVILEISGYGFNVLQSIFVRSMTDATGFRLNDIWNGAPPRGPRRLTREERVSLSGRLNAAFPTGLRKARMLSDMEWAYELDGGELCRWRGRNIAVEPHGCNRVRSARPWFLALLRTMHPSSESFLMDEVHGARGDVVRMFFFVGVTGTPKILVDLTEVTAGWNLAKGFVLKAEHGRSLTELSLGRPLSGVGGTLYVIDDPGALERRLWMCGSARCPAAFHLYGVPQSSAKTGLGEAVEANIAEVSLTDELEQRHQFHAVVMGRAFEPAAAVPEQAFKPEAFAVTTFDTVHLDRKIEAILGQGARNEVTYSSIGVRVAFGSMFGMSYRGALYTLFDGGPGYMSLGTDRFVFDVVADGHKRRLDDVRSASGLYLLPFSGSSAAKSAKVEVRKFTAQTGQPWSELTDFHRVFQPLRAR